MDKMKMETANKTLEKLDILKEMFPEVITETKDENGDIISAVDAKKLEQLLSTKVIEGDESYDFTWVGKKQAMVEASRPIRKTLRPCKEESVDWDKTENLYIEGDNLDVLKLLQESYLNKIKMIYIDPPYNTGNDSFIYPDDYKTNKDQYDEEVGAIDESGYRMFKNTETNGRFHSSWCSMMYPRLKLARNLLSEDGVIFISIDDNEVDNLKKMCDEVCGSENFIGLFVINSTPNARDYGHIGKMTEYAVFYAKNINFTTTNMLPEIDKTFKYTDEKGGYNIHPLYNSNEAFTNKNRPNLYYPFYLYLNEPVSKEFYTIGLEKKENSIEIYPPKSIKNNVQFVWRWGKDKAQNNLNTEIIGYKTENGEYRIVQKMRHTEKIIRNLLTDTSYTTRRGTAEVEEIFGDKYFSFPKPINLLKNFITVGSDEASIILDFFSGSATTAHAVMQLNAEDGGKRKFIMVQLPEVCDEKSETYKAGYQNICEIGKERIRRAGKKIVEETGKTDLDIGFRVLKLDESNMKDVYYAPADYNQSMLDRMTSNIKEDRTPEDLLYACMLEWGLELSLPHETKAINGYNIHIVNEGDLIACFDEKVSEDVIKQIADMKPLRVVFRDSSFATDSARINVDEIFKLKSPNTNIKVL
ncbi:MAG: site-specific DNA-methyltransferase [Alphaproteobacteria bacterium]|nr:site-specific DNA-methyltransferase [Alphaproteobacteria bacterium]